MLNGLDRQQVKNVCLLNIEIGVKNKRTVGASTKSYFATMHLLKAI